MDYAEDRLDRQKAVAADSDTSSETVLPSLYHRSLARSLRNAGRNRRAVFHAAKSGRVGDYAQTAEFGGYPEVALLVLLQYWRGGGQQEWNKESTEKTLKKCTVDTVEEVVDGTRKEPTDETECTDDDDDVDEEGKYPCYFPIEKEELEAILDDLQTYIRVCHDRQQRPQQQQRPQNGDDMPTAHQVLGCLMMKSNASNDLKQSMLTHISIDTPPSLHFWKEPKGRIQQDGHDNEEVLVLQLLLIKLLYLTIPSLACEGLIHLWDKLEQNSRRMAQHYKSHWAYLVLIRAVAFGERIKPHRRRAFGAYYHVPVWDLLWGHDGRVGTQQQQGQQQQQECDHHINNTNNSNDIHKRRPLLVSQDIVDHFRRVALYCMGNVDAGSVGVDSSPSKPTSLPELFHGYDGRKPLFVVGDSHVLSIAWQTVAVPTVSSSSTPLDEEATTTVAIADQEQQQQHLDYEHRLLIPVVVTGLKAWHCRQETRFFTRSQLTVSLGRLVQTNDTTTNRTILMSAGEIDCREGIGGPVLEGYGDNGASVFRQHVHRTVQAFVGALHQEFSLPSCHGSDMDRTKTTKVWVLPVAPHAHRSERNGKSVGRAFRRRVTECWNEELRLALPRGSIALLDYAQDLLVENSRGQDDPVDKDTNNNNRGGEGYVLKERYNADYTHMNSAFLPCLERAMDVVVSKGRWTD